MKTVNREVCGLSGETLTLSGKTQLGNLAVFCGMNRLTRLLTLSYVISLLFIQRNFTKSNTFFQLHIHTGIYPVQPQSDLLATEQLSFTCSTHIYLVGIEPVIFPLQAWSPSLNHHCPFESLITSSEFYF